MLKDISFKGKVLLFILPVTILGFLLLSFVSYKYVDLVLETELLGGSQRETLMLGSMQDCLRRKLPHQILLLVMLLPIRLQQQKTMSIVFN